jgi:hypothetical protein
MLNLKVPRAKLKILSMIVVLGFPILLCGQAVQSIQSAGPALGQRFAEIGESLTSKADALLVNADRPVGVRVEGTQSLELSHKDSPVPPKQERAPSKSAGLGLAVARVEILRAAIDPILRGEGVPMELTAVVLIESGGNTLALSPKGARGLWQLMPDTARRYGLVVDGVADERLNTEKSTRAAARYLSDLHLQFGSWSLALAAYNTGEQNIQRAIGRSHSTEFTVLSSSGLLPLETRNYVPAVMAATQLFGQPAALGAEHFTPLAITIFATSSP